MGVDIEPEELAVLESLLILGMQIGAAEPMRAVVEIGAVLRFIEHGVVMPLCFVLAQHFLRIRFVALALVQGLVVWEIGE